MNPFNKSTLRTTIAAVAIIGLTTSAFARSSLTRIVLNCNHEDTFADFVPNPDPGTVGVMPMVPLTMNLEVAGAGVGTQLCGTVVCISQNYSFDLVSKVGSATFKMRDSTGDVLVYKADLMLCESKDGKHAGEFEGTYQVESELCTGRFADATGSGHIWGWADNDEAPQAGSGQGYSEMTGTLVLKKKTSCKK